MKLIYCMICKDVFKPRVQEVLHCKCGHAGGYYVNNVFAEFWGEFAVPLVLNNRSLIRLWEYVFSEEPVHMDFWLAVGPMGGHWEWLPDGQPEQLTPPEAKPWEHVKY